MSTKDLGFCFRIRFFIKADRAQDVTFHRPESATIYADRIVEKVPIMNEVLSCCMGSDPKLPGGKTVPSMVRETKGLSTWSKEDFQAKRLRTTCLSGPPWNLVERRVTTMIADETAEDHKGRRKDRLIPEGPRDVETFLYFRLPSVAKGHRQKKHQSTSNDSACAVGGVADKHPHLKAHPAKPSSSSRTNSIVRSLHRRMWRSQEGRCRRCQANEGRKKKSIELKWKPDPLPRFGEGDELLMCKEAVASEGDTQAQLKSMLDSNLGKPSPQASPS